MDSILDSVKSYVGLASDDTSYDTDILMAINAVMVTLNQLGVGPAKPCIVSNSSSKWSEIVDEDNVGIVREYVNMRVRMLFDPPTNTYVVEALKNQIDEFEWRILVDVDRKEAIGE